MAYKITVTHVLFLFCSAGFVPTYSGDYTLLEAPHNMEIDKTAKRIFLSTCGRGITQIGNGLMILGSTGAVTTSLGNFMLSAVGIPASYTGAFVNRDNDDWNIACKMNGWPSYELFHIGDSVAHKYDISCKFNTSLLAFGLAIYLGAGLKKYGKTITATYASPPEISTEILLDEVGVQEEPAFSGQAKKSIFRQYLGNFCKKTGVALTTLSLVVVTPALWDRLQGMTVDRMTERAQKCNAPEGPIAPSVAENIKHAKIMLYTGGFIALAGACTYLTGLYIFRAGQKIAPAEHYKLQRISCCGNVAELIE